MENGLAEEDMGKGIVVTEPRIRLRMFHLRLGDHVRYITAIVMIKYNRYLHSTYNLPLVVMM